MNWIKRASINLSVILLSSCLTLGLFELFLIYENSFESVPSFTKNLNGHEFYLIDREGVEESFNINNPAKEIFVIGDSFVSGIFCASSKRYAWSIRGNSVGLR